MLEGKLYKGTQLCEVRQSAAGYLEPKNTQVHEWHYHEYLASNVTVSQNTHTHTHTEYTANTHTHPTPSLLIAMVMNVEICVQISFAAWNVPLKYMSLSRACHHDFLSSPLGIKLPFIVKLQTEAGSIPSKLMAGILFCCTCQCLGGGMCICCSCFLPKWVVC